MLVQLRSTQHVEEHGKIVSYVSGECVDVGKQLGGRWIAEGAATLAAPGATETVKNVKASRPRSAAELLPGALAKARRRRRAAEAREAHARYVSTLA